jgi:hypothetical protein
MPYRIEIEAFRKCCQTLIARLQVGLPMTEVEHQLLTSHLVILAGAIERNVQASGSS